MRLAVGVGVCGARILIYYSDIIGAVEYLRLVCGIAVSPMRLGREGQGFRMRIALLGC